MTDTIGSLVRSHRTQAGLTQTALAAKAGVTKGFVSQLERDEATPSIDTLRRLAAAFAVPIFYLMPGLVRPNGVVHSNERKIIRLSPNHVSYELLTPDLKGQIEMIRMVLPPGGSSCTEPLGHPGEEVAVILRGSVKMHIGPETFELTSGDSIRFDCTIPHRLVNEGAEEMELISAITPPRF